MQRWQRLRKKWISFTPAGRSWRKRRLDCSRRQTKGDDRISASSRTRFNLLEQNRFQVVGLRLHLAGSNLLVRSAVVAEFADPQTVFGSNRRSKNATGHRTGIIEFTIPGFRIECGARLVVRKIRETLSRVVSLVQNTAHRIAG